MNIEQRLREPKNEDRDRVLETSFNFFFKSSPEDIFFHCFERERKGGKERERNINVREKHRSFAFLYVPWLGIEPATFQSTGGLSNQLSCTGQGLI